MSKLSSPDLSVSEPGTPRFLPSRILARYVSFSVRHYGKLLFGALLLSLLALVPATRLELHTDMAELLPDDHPALRALRRIAGRQKSATNLVLIVESPDQTANQRFTDVLRPALEKLVPDVFTEIQWRPNTEISEHAARWRWLYAEKDELLRAEELLDRLVARRKSPLLVDLEGDPEEEIRALRMRLDQRLPPTPSQTFFSTSSGGLHSIGGMLWRRLEGVGSLGEHQTLRVVQTIVDGLRPTSFHPGMRVRYTGHIAMAIAEQNAVREDVTIATSICTTLVLLAIYLYFRRIGILVIVGTPAFLGVLLSLALARLTIQYLNLNTAFLISIILGNGINTPIVLLARYGEERRAGRDVSEGLVRALDRTLLGTATAMLAASIAYGCLSMTSFRGFSQFGFIGGAGMILVWLCTFLLAPPLVIWGERLRPGVLTPRPSLWRPPFALLGRVAERHPIALGLGVVAFLVASVPLLLRYARDPLEWNMRNLRSAEAEPDHLWEQASAMGMGEVGAGFIGSTAVLLVDDPGQAEGVAAALLEKDRRKGPKQMLHTVRTLNSVLPQEQAAKMEILERIRTKIDRNRPSMSDEEWADVQPFYPPPHLRPLTVVDLPRQVLEAFTEVDGQRGRLIGVDAGNYSDWDGHDLLRLADALTVDVDGRTWVAASTSTVFGGMLDLIHRDGVPVTITALLGVSALVFVSFGLRGGWPVLLSLTVGLTWLGGLLGLIKLKLNFMNFIAVPITVGIGVEYAANVWARIRREGYAAVREAIADTGSAVALCSATTIIGYSSLLLARNRALKSFGIVADIGEITCLMAALVVLPVLAWLSSRRRAESKRGGGKCG